MTLKSGCPTILLHPRRPTTQGLRCDHSRTGVFPTAGQPFRGSLGALVDPLSAALARPPDRRATASAHRNAVLSP